MSNNLLTMLDVIDSVAGPSEAVAYLDIGTGGYLDLGTDMTYEALSRLPKGRHALVIAGTYGIDGYTAAPQADNQPVPVPRWDEMIRQQFPDMQPKGWSDTLIRRYMTRELDAYRASRAPADSVLEDAARLDWLALAGPTSICVVIDREHDGEVEVSTDDVTCYGKTLREAIDAARKQGAKHD